MSSDQSEIVERLSCLHVWPQSIADEWADTLTPRQIEKLYEVGKVATDAQALIEQQAREIARLREALKQISETPNAGWIIARAALKEPKS